jgi:hypothetical protein
MASTDGVVMRCGARCPWHAVAQLLEALRYKPEGHGYDSRWCLGNFFIDIVLPAAL